MEMAYNGLLVEHEKLEKACNDELSIIEQLRSTVEKDVDIIAALKKENAELAKASGEKDLKILNTEEELARLVKGIAEETKAWRSNFELLFEKYEDALSTFGARPNPFPATGGPQEMMDWMAEEFGSLPEVITGASDFAAIFYSESLLKLLESRDCTDLPKFQTLGLDFPDDSSVSRIRASQDVQIIKKNFVKKFWMAYRQEFAKEIAREKLSKVISTGSDMFSWKM